MSGMMTNAEAIETLRANYPDACYEQLRCAVDMAINALTAQPERKRGEWTNNNSCPFCGFEPWYEGDIHSLSFCPNCGARMEGES